jgi:hypothetical protein
MTFHLPTFARAYRAKSTNYRYFFQKLQRKKLWAFRHWPRCITYIVTHDYLSLNCRNKTYIHIQSGFGGPQKDPTQTHQYSFLTFPKPHSSSFTKPCFSLLVFIWIFKTDTPQNTSINQSIYRSIHLSIYQSL